MAQYNYDVMLKFGADASDAIKQLDTVYKLQAKIDGETINLKINDSNLQAVKKQLSDMGRKDIAVAIDFQINKQKLDQLQKQKQNLEDIVTTPKQTLKALISETEQYSKQGASVEQMQGRIKDIVNMMSHAQKAGIGDLSYDDKDIEKLEKLRKQYQIGDDFKGHDPMASINASIKRTEDEIDELKRKYKDLDLDFTTGKGGGSGNGSGISDKQVKQIQDAADKIDASADKIDTAANKIDTALNGNDKKGQLVSNEEVQQTTDAAKQLEKNADSITESKKKIDEANSSTGNVKKPNSKSSKEYADGLDVFYKGQSPTNGAKSVHKDFKQIEKLNNDQLKNAFDSSVSEFNKIADKFNKANPLDEGFDEIYESFKSAAKSVYQHSIILNNRLDSLGKLVQQPEAKESLNNLQDNVKSTVKDVDRKVRGGRTKLQKATSETTASDQIPATDTASVSNANNETAETAKKAKAAEEDLGKAIKETNNTKVDSSVSEQHEKDKKSAEQAAQAINKLNETEQESSSTKTPKDTTSQSVLDRIKKNRSDLFYDYDKKDIDKALKPLAQKYAKSREKNRNNATTDDKLEEALNYMSYSKAWDKAKSLHSSKADEFNPKNILGVKNNSKPQTVDRKKRQNYEDFLDDYFSVYNDVQTKFGNIDLSKKLTIPGFDSDIQGNTIKDALNYLVEWKQDLRAYQGEDYYDEEVKKFQDAQAKFFGEIQKNNQGEQPSLTSDESTKKDAQNAEETKQSADKIKQAKDEVNSSSTAQTKPLIQDGQPENDLQKAQTEVEAAKKHTEAVKEMNETQTDVDDKSSTQMENLTDSINEATQAQDKFNESKKQGNAVSDQGSIAETGTEASASMEKLTENINEASEANDKLQKNMRETQNVADQTGNTGNGGDTSSVSKEQQELENLKSSLNNARIAKENLKGAEQGLGNVTSTTTGLINEEVSALTHLTEAASKAATAKQSVTDNEGKLAKASEKTNKQETKAGSAKNNKSLPSSKTASNAQVPRNGNNPQRVVSEYWDETGDNGTVTTETQKGIQTKTSYKYNSKTGNVDDYTSYVNNYKSLESKIKQDSKKMVKLQQDIQDLQNQGINTQWLQNALNRVKKSRQDSIDALKAIVNDNSFDYDQDSFDAFQKQDQQAMNLMRSQYAQNQVAKQTREAKAKGDKANKKVSEAFNKRQGMIDTVSTISNYGSQQLGWKDPNDLVNQIYALFRDQNGKLIDPDQINKTVYNSLLNRMKKEITQTQNTSTKAMDEFSSGKLASPITQWTDRLSSFNGLDTSNLTKARNLLADLKQAWSDVGNATTDADRADAYNRMKSILDSMNATWTDINSKTSTENTLLNQQAKIKAIDDDIKAKNTSSKIESLADTSKDFQANGVSIGRIPEYDQKLSDIRAQYEIMENKSGQYTDAQRIQAQEKLNSLLKEESNLRNDIMLSQSDQRKALDAEKKARADANVKAKRDAKKSADTMSDINYQASTGQKSASIAKIQSQVDQYINAGVNTNRISGINSTLQNAQGKLQQAMDTSKQDSDRISAWKQAKTLIDSATASMQKLKAQDNAENQALQKANKTRRENEAQAKNDEKYTKNMLDQINSESRTGTKQSQLDILRNGIDQYTKNGINTNNTNAVDSAVNQANNYLKIAENANKTDQERVDAWEKVCELIQTANAGLNRLNKAGTPEKDQLDTINKQKKQTQAEQRRNQRKQKNNAQKIQDYYSGTDAGIDIQKYKNRMNPYSSIDIQNMSQADIKANGLKDLARAQDIINELESIQAKFNSGGFASATISDLSKLYEHVDKLKTELAGLFSIMKDNDSPEKTFMKGATDVNSAVQKMEKSLSKYTEDGKYSSHIQEQAKDIYNSLQKINGMSTADAQAQLQKLDAQFQKLQADAKQQGPIIDFTKVKNAIAQMSEYLRNNSALTSEYRNEIKQLQDTLQQGLSNGGVTKNQFKDIMGQQSDIKRVANDAGVTGKGFAETVQDRIKGDAANFISQWFSAQDIIRYAQEIAQNVTDVDSALIELQKVSDASNTRIQQDFRTSAETAKQLGASVSDVINSTADWSRLGYSVDDAEKMAKATTLFQSVGDDMTQESASKALISTMKAYNVTADQGINTVSKYNEVQWLAARLS